MQERNDTLISLHILVSYYHRTFSRLKNGYIKFEGGWLATKHSTTYFMSFKLWNTSGSFRGLKYPKYPTSNFN